MPVAVEHLINAAAESGLIEAAIVPELRVKARRERSDLLEVIASYGRFPVSAFYRALAAQRGLRYIDFAIIDPPTELVRRLPESLARRRLIFPLLQENGEILIVTADPDDRQSLDAVQRIVGIPAKLAVSDPDTLKTAIDSAFRDKHTAAHIEPARASIDAVELFDRIMKEAFLCRASDIHLEPAEQGLVVRLRIDGRLQCCLANLGTESGASLLSRIKVLAGLDIAEQRAPQDGGFSYQLPLTASKKIDIRVATISTRWGERATLRLLGTETQDLTLESLGMSHQNLEQFRKVIQRPYGMILLTGPTGSGKSTTLYAALCEINRPHINIMTVEDPIEYSITGISQVQISGGEKMNFAKALRALLRHDPDVLMVGEIRDAETADIAMKAAMTGHLVFSTLHTNSACAAVTRLTDIGCEPFLIGSTLAAAIAQRLVRRLCSLCKKPRTITPEEAALLGVGGDEGINLYEPVGCAYCLGTGYRGRIALFETLWIDQPLARLISSGTTEAEIRSACKGFTTLLSDGCDKARAGLVTLDEVMTAVIQEV
ncbi:MAG: ATPase, T2SS/T4P/T4SS family [Deltaproteobacteria bacterium]|nr:ATPase, T2SS/T4P/T4SS family [Deltaproteobacteria bacterium]